MHSTPAAVKTAPILSALSRIQRAPEVMRCGRETPDWLSVTLAYLGIQQVAYPYQLKLRNMPPLLLREPYDLRTFWQIFAHRCYKVLNSDRNILDAGANIGLFSLYAARKARKAQILAIEPFPETFQRLTELVRINGFSDRVRCLNTAICGSDEPRVMKAGGQPSQMRFVAPKGSEAEGIEVQAKTLAQILKMVDGPVDLMKMDIEGSEYEVLLNTPPEVLRGIRRIVLEYHGDRGPKALDDLFEGLKRAGFRVQSDERDSLNYGVVELV